MQPVEALLEVGEPVAAHLVRVERDRDLVALPVVAHVGDVGDAPGVGGDALALEPLRRARAEPVEDLGDLVAAGVARAGGCTSGRTRRGSRRRGRRSRRAGPAPAGRSPGTSPSASPPRSRAAARRRRRRRARSRAGRGRAATETSRSAPAMFSLTIVDDPLGRLLDRVEAHRVGDLLHGRPRRLDVELHLAAEQRGGRWPRTTFASVTVGSVPPLP